MFRLRLHPPPVAQAADVHGAARVVADESLRAAGGDTVALVLNHGAANLGIFDGESAAEAAALVGFFHGAEIDVADLAEKFDPFVGDADAAEVARVVIGNR